MKGKIQNIFTSEKVLLASRIILGSIFIAASVGKLSHPDEFVTLVASYNILPYGLAIAYGYLVPWLELLIGLFLILGLFARFVSAFSVPLIISFIVASSYELLTGAGESCGCFGDVMPLTLPQSLNLDALMLLLTIPLIIHGTSLLSVQQWLAGPENYHLKTGGFAFSGAGKIVAIIAVITLLLFSSPQTVQATMTSDQNLATAQPVFENTIVLNEEIQGPDGVKNVIKDPSTNTAPNVSLDGRINTALETKEAVFLFFYTDWCGYCKKQKPILDVLEPEFSGDITFIRVNADENRQAMQQFGVTGFPTMYLITDKNKNGDFISQRFVGYTDEMNLKASFDRIISDGDGPSQGAVSAAIARPANNPAPVLNNGGTDITCFGLPPDSSLVCGGHGQCVATDSCECNDYWTGQECTAEEVQCNGLYYSDPLVCSGNGDCNLDGTCTCYEDWDGDNCENYTGVTCYGVAADDPTACYGNGVCENDGTCTCNEYWTGDECQTEIICNGVPANDESVCGGHGTCEDTMTCTCDSPYTGFNCDELLPEPIFCYGVSATDAAVCSENGVCVATDTCVCDGGYTGDQCDIDEVLFYISIDIKPGSDPNSINLGSNGVIPVAILTDGSFDAASVNATTVLFGRTGSEAEPVHYALDDVDDDGDMDMIFHFRTQETGLEAEDTEAMLTGQTIDGIEITGTDSVRIVPPKGKGKPNKGSKPEKGGGQDNGNGNPNPGQGNNQGGENGNSNPGQGGDQGNQNGNPNPGQGNNQGGENGNSNPGQGNGKGKGNK